MHSVITWLTLPDGISSQCNLFDGITVVVWVIIQQLLHIQIIALWLSPGNDSSRSSQTAFTNSIELLAAFGICICVVSVLLTVACIVVTFTLCTEIHCAKRQQHSALTRKGDTGRRPPQIVLISHQDTKADMPLVCCLPSMTRTTCVPCLAWRRGTHFVFSNSWSRPPEKRADKAKAAGAGDALPALPSDVKRRGQWPLIFRFYFHLHFDIRDTRISIYVMFGD